eukprot:EG_transcript_36263
MDRSQKRCHHERGPRERCMMPAAEGKPFCEAHLCPNCQKDKASNSPTCVDCKPSPARPLPPPPGTAETCHYEGTAGRCTLQRRYDTYYCNAHACPTCKQMKEEASKKCVTHLQPCKSHSWEDSGRDLLFKRCMVCDCTMSGRQSLRCKECGNGAHRRCVTKTNTNTVA